MDATRPRRTRDAARRRWYAVARSVRFARLLGFLDPAAADPKTQELTFGSAAVSELPRRLD